MDEWKRLVVDKSVPSTANGLTLTTRALFQSMVDGDVISFDSLVAEDVNPLHLCVCLRGTFRKRNTTPYWDEALEIAKQACMLNGVDPETALSGLLK